MKYIFQFCRILFFCFLGELLHIILPLPIPSSIYGLILLLVALLTGVLKLDQVKETGLFLTGIFPVLFVPAAVGVMERFDDIAQLIIPIILAVFVVTALVMAVSGKVTQVFLKDKKVN